MLRTKINLLTQKTVLKSSLFQTFFSADFCEAYKFQFLSSFCTDLWDTHNSKNIFEAHRSSYLYGVRKIP